MDYDLAIQTIKQVLLGVRPKLLKAFGDVKSTDKSDGSSVTELDVFVEQQLKESLRRLDPGIGFYGEETEHDKLADRSWIIDPIDGTDYFIRGIPLCANLVALYEDGQAVLGVVYNFTTDEFFYAIRGKGAFLNDSPVHIIDRPLQKAILIYESKTEKENDFDNLRALSEVLTASNIFHQYISGYQLAQLAMGKYDGIICREPYENMWDVAAGNLLVEEAGGIVRNLNSDHYSLQNLNFIASTKILFEELRSKNLV